MKPRVSLTQVEVARSCSADWEQMDGDTRRRFCSHCGKFVHDLSAMPTTEAEQLVCRSGGNLCVRFSRDPATGRIMTLDYEPAAPRRQGPWAVWVSALCIGGLGAAAISPALVRTRTMGIMAVSPPTTQPIAPSIATNPDSTEQPDDGIPPPQSAFAP